MHSIRLGGSLVHDAIAEPSHARERRWPVGFEININSRRPVMRVVRQQRNLPLLASSNLGRINERSIHIRLDYIIAMIAICGVCGCTTRAPDVTRSMSIDVASERERNAREALAAGVPAATRDAQVETPPRTWRGVDLSKAPVTTDVSTLPLIWEERPQDSRSFEVRADVFVIQPEEIGDPTVYWAKESNRYYIQDDPLGSSTLHFYGPFSGDPRKRLELTDSVY